jgi:hypothetical protein
VAVETEFDGSVRHGYDISRLIAAIQKVSTASREDKNPFQLVDVYHPMYYSHVKAAAVELKQQFKLMTLMALHEEAVKRAGPAAQNSGITPKDTAGAVAYLTCIGEVITGSAIHASSFFHSVYWRSVGDLVPKHVALWPFAGRRRS